MRDCQPAPLLRKKATTSGSSRSDTRVLTGFDFCGPRWPRKRRINSGRTSATRRNCASCCSVNGGLSGSRNAAACIAASSSSVVRSISSRAMRRASSQLRGPVDLLSLRLSLIGPLFRRLRLAQTDHPDDFAEIVRALREDEHIKAFANKSDRLLPKLAIVLAGVNSSDGKVPIEPIDRGEIDAMLLEVLPALAF